MTNLPTWHYSQKTSRPTGVCSPAAMNGCPKSQGNRVLGNNPCHSEFLAIIFPTCAVETWQDWPNRKRLRDTSGPVLKWLVSHQRTRSPAERHNSETNLRENSQKIGDTHGDVIANDTVAGAKLVTVVGMGISMEPAVFVESASLIRRPVPVILMTVTFKEELNQVQLWQVLH